MQSSLQPSLSPHAAGRLSLKNNTMGCSNSTLQRASSLSTNLHHVWCQKHCVLYPAHEVGALAGDIGRFDVRKTVMRQSNNDPTFGHETTTGPNSLFSWLSRGRSWSVGKLPVSRQQAEVFGRDREREGAVMKPERRRSGGDFRGWDKLGFRKLEVQKWEKRRETRRGQEGDDSMEDRRETVVREGFQSVVEVETKSGNIQKFASGDKEMKNTKAGTKESGASGGADDSSGTELNCDHFQRCSGCTLERALDKPPIAAQAERFFHDRAFHAFKMTTGEVWEWRCRAKLVVQGTPTDPVIGLYEGGTHRALNIPSCRAHHPHINAAVDLVRRVITRLRVQPYDENTGSGQLRYLQMVVSTNDTKLPAAERYVQGKVQVSLVWNVRDETGPDSELLLRMAEVLYRLGGPTSPRHILHSVWANFQTSRSNVILGQRWRHLRGEAEMWERMGGVDICFTPASFGQANYRAFEALLRSLQRHVPRGSRLSELYAGVGAIGLSLAASRQCRRVRCVEVNQAARAPFDASLRRLPPSLQAIASWHCADASSSPIKWLQGADVVVVDPPRKGLGPPVVEALRLASVRARGLAKSPSRSVTDKVEKRPWIVRAQTGAVPSGRDTEASRGEEAGKVEDEEEDRDDDTDGWPNTLVYVSCGWETFQEDCRSLLQDDAWHLHHAEGFQFFPGTDSIETLAVFKVGKRPKKKGVKGKVKTGPKKEKRNKSAKSLRESSAGEGGDGVDSPVSVIEASVIESTAQA